MEDWITALRTVQNREYFESTQYSMDHFSGMHNWYACSHARPTYCNVCREALSGVTSHGLSCEVCKFKAHKRCAVRANNNCKWSTLASIGKDIIEDEDGISMPHQWLEGNLPVSAKCTICDKTCGSVLRLQDWRCLWCKAMVHTVCIEQLSNKCPLGQCKVSVIPPTALNSIDSDGFWKASCPPSCTSPLLVFVNSKSGDNQGVKFLRRFKQLLNPAQVFDLMNGGPHLGLRLFQKFDTFRILVCGGDGSVGWVLSEIDALTLHKQCQLGVLPLGTGNDLARVLGWGSACDDDTQLPQILEKLERASTKMLDRWSIMVYETKIPRQHSSSTMAEDCNDDSEVQQILTYEDSVAAHLSKILTSDQHSVVISSAKVLCETVKDFVARVGKAYEKTPEYSEESEAMAKKCLLLIQCGVLKEKLDSLLKTLNEEAQASTILPSLYPTIAEEQEKGEGLMMTSPCIPPTPCSPRTTSTIFTPREQLMLRANSLKKAIRQIIEHTEKAVDDQNAQTQQQVFSLATEEEDEDDERNSLQSTYSGSTSQSIKARPSGRGLRAGMTGFLSNSSVISRLLVNADSFSCDPENFQCYTEKCVMNNYFGIGLDAKISLDFNNKRDEHPEKCRSRTKNMMWYGVLGTKELLHRTYKNLEQKVLLEAFENTLKSWEDKQKCEFPRPSSQHALPPEIVSEEEAAQINLFGQAAGAFIHSIREIAQSHQDIEQELAHAVNASCKAMDVVYAKSKNPEGLNCSSVVQMVSNVKALHNETELLLASKMCMQLDPPQKEQLNGSLTNVTQHLQRLADIAWLCQLIEPADEVHLMDLYKRNRSGKFRLVPKFKKEKNNKNKEASNTLSLPVNQWSTEEVAAWLELICLSEYKEIFIGHDIRGAELLHLERRDLKELGVTKVGHMKRILQGIRELSRTNSTNEA
nr:diacylglycerol kinase delta isoform X5 [Paramormyrops kingsleyae]